MLDIAALKASFPTLNTLHSSSLVKPKRAAAQPKHPRNNVIALIENSIRFLADPQYRVKQKRSGNTAPPQTCYKIDAAGNAYISLSYAKKKLVIDNGDDTITVPAATLPQVLEKIKEQVANGKLDAELNNTQSERSSTMKQKMAEKKAAANALKNVA
jgi:hypothetical protein